MPDSSSSGSSGLNRRTFLGFGILAALSLPRVGCASTNSSDGERTLSFSNLHTGESLKTVYWVKGEYIPESLNDINRILRDYRNGETHPIDHRLLDLLSDLRLQLETTQPFELISGYRSPATNAMLRQKSEGVAQHSLHMDGMAADIRIPGKSLASLRKTALALKRGGVGYYPASQFVHVDVGRVRFW